MIDADLDVNANHMICAGVFLVLRTGSQEAHVKPISQQAGF